MADRDEKVGEERSSQYDNRDVQVDIQGQGGEVDAYDTVVGERDRTDCRVGEHPFHQRHGRVPSDQSFVDNYINRKTALCDQAEDISPHVIAAVSCYRRLLSAQNKRQGTCRPDKDTEDLRSRNRFLQVKSSDDHGDDGGGGGNDRCVYG